MLYQIFQLVLSSFRKHQSEAQKLKKEQLEKEKKRAEKKAKEAKEREEAERKKKEEEAEEPKIKELTDEEAEQLQKELSQVSCQFWGVQIAVRVILHGEKGVGFYLSIMIIIYLRWSVCA